MKNGTRVKVASGGLKEFHGHTGTVQGFEKDGATKLYRVYLDKPVEVAGVGQVRSDLWAREHLTKLSSR